MGIYAVKTTASQEQTVADMIINREEAEIHAALAPDSLTSYVMVEADDNAVLERVLEEIPHARSIVPGESDISEVEHFLSPKPDVEGSPRATSSSSSPDRSKVRGPGPAHRRGQRSGDGRTVRGDGADSGDGARRSDSSPRQRRTVVPRLEWATHRGRDRFRRAVASFNPPLSG